MPAVQPQHFAELYAYNAWANRRLWNSVMTLSESQFRQPLSYGGTIRDQVTHMLAVESWWPHFLASGELVFLDPDTLPDREAIRAAWDSVEARNRAFLERLTPAELTREVRPEFWDPTEGPIQVWEALIQVLNHSTDHRAQTLAGLSQLGAPTFEQDFLSYLHRPS